MNVIYRVVYMNKYFIPILVVMLLFVNACALITDTDGAGSGSNISVTPIYDNNEQNPEDVVEPINSTDAEKEFPLPLMDMTAGEKYYGESGGLYGNGLNIPPEFYRQAAFLEASTIQPLDSDGVMSDAGLIGFIAVGHTNAKLSFDTFMKYAELDNQINKRIVFANGAQLGKDAYQWATNPAAMTGLRLAMKNAGLTNKQVQVAWIELSDSKPIGEFPYDANKLQKYLYIIVPKLKVEYPNLKIVYFSSDVYGGYSSKDILEPYAYESAFSIKWSIIDQINGDAELNYDAKKGVVKAPIMLWGPYLWANDDNKRSDGLVWVTTDFGDDGATLSNNGTIKVAQMMSDFFKNTNTTRTWFVK
jgi:hypothetical protein